MWAAAILGPIPCFAAVQTCQDEHIILHGSERRQNRRQRKRSLDGRCPLPHVDAHGHIDGGEPRARLRDLPAGTPDRHHGIEPWQRDRRPKTAENCTTWNTPAGADHGNFLI